MIEVATVLIVLTAVCCCARTMSKKRPMDHDVVLRIRSLADQMRREQLLPYE